MYSQPLVGSGHPSFSKLSIWISGLGILIAGILLGIIVYACLDPANQTTSNQGGALDPLSATSLNASRMIYQEKLTSAGPFADGTNRPSTTLHENGLITYQNPSLNLSFTYPAFRAAAKGIQADGSEVLTDLQIPTVVFEQNESTPIIPEVYTLLVGSGFTVSYSNDSAIVKEQPSTAIGDDSKTGKITVFKLDQGTDPQVALKAVYSDCGEPTISTDQADTSRELWEFPQALESCVLSGRMVWHFPKSIVVSYPLQTGCYFSSQSSASPDPTIDLCQDRAIIRSFKEI